MPLSEELNSLSTCPQIIALRGTDVTVFQGLNETPLNT